MRFGGNVEELSTNEVARRLNSSIGATLVATLAGSKDPRISYRWAEPDGPDPTKAQAERLLLAHQAWTAISHAEGGQYARAWFIGANPLLGDVSPVEAISQLRTDDVGNAVAAQAENRFVG